MKILAVDPGRTTGICVLESDQTNSIRVAMANQIPWEVRKLQLWALIAGTSVTWPLGQPDAIVIEDFKLRPGRAMEQIGSDFPSVHIIGMVEGFHFALQQTCPIVYQTPAIIGRVQILPPHEKLLAGQEHAKDAYKHARYYLITKANKHEPSNS